MIPNENLQQLTSQWQISNSIPFISQDNNSFLYHPVTRVCCKIADNLTNNNINNLNLKKKRGISWHQKIRKKVNSFDIEIHKSVLMMKRYVTTELGSVLEICHEMY